MEKVLGQLLYHQTHTANRIAHTLLALFGEEWLMPLILNVQSIGISWGFPNSGNHWKHGSWQKDKSIKMAQSCVHAWGWNIKKSMYCVFRGIFAQFVVQSLSHKSDCLTLFFVVWNGVVVVLEDTACCSPRCPVVMSGRRWMGEVQSRRMSQ